MLLIAPELFSMATDTFGDPHVGPPVSVIVQPSRVKSVSGPRLELA
jgi:hypothetical protein